MRLIGKVSAIALATACLVGGGVASLPSVAVASTVVDLGATFSDTGLNSGQNHELLSAAFTLTGDVITDATGNISGSIADGALTLLPVGVGGAASLPGKNPNDNVLTGIAYYFSDHGSLFIVGTGTPDGKNKENIVGLDLFTFNADKHIRESLFDAVYNTKADTLSNIVFLTPTGGTGTDDIDSNSQKSINSSISITPLPSTWTMLIAGFVGLGFLTYRGSKQRASATAAG